MRVSYSKQQSGFTLVEMLVSISLFTVVLTMSVGTLLILIDANGRAQSMQLVMTNLTFALDSMTREIRTGFNWYCADTNAAGGPIPARTALNDCDGGTSGDFISVVETGDNLTEKLAFCSGDPSSCSHRVTYWYDSDYYGTGHGAIMRTLGTDGSGGTTNEGGEAVPLTGADIWIDEMKIVVSGTARQQVSDDTVQPTASIYIRGRAGVTVADIAGVQEREFDIQTTVTQRLLDI